MNNFVPFVLNSALILLECSMTAFLSVCFFQKRVRNILFAVSILILGILNCAVIYLWRENTVAKVALGIFLPAIWIKCIFRTGIPTALFLALLLLSYWTIADSLFLMGMSLLIGSNTIYTSPYSYYLMCFVAKAIELFGIVILRAIL